MTSPNGSGPARPVVLLCECAGTLKNVDFDRLERAATCDLHDAHGDPQRRGAFDLDASLPGVGGKEEGQAEEAARK